MASSLHPFHCPVCQKRFTRHENYKRHSAIHRTDDEGGRSHVCPHCSAVFTRRDLCRRHVARKHADLDGHNDSDLGIGTSTRTRTSSRRGESSTSRSASPRVRAAAGRSGTPPNRRPDASISTKGMTTSAFDYSLPPLAPRPSIPADPPPSTAQAGLVGETSASSPFDWVKYVDSLAAGSDARRPDVAVSASHPMLVPQTISTQIQSTSPAGPLASPESSMSTRPIDLESLLSSESITRGIDVFFQHVDQIFPFLHRPTFNPATAPTPLVLGIISASAHLAPDAGSGGSVGESGGGDGGDGGRGLATRCYHRGRYLLDQEMAGKKAATPLVTLGLIQAHLLLEMHAIMYACGVTTSEGLNLHRRCIELARKAGLMEPYPSHPSLTRDLDSLWSQFVRAETHKRTLFSIYQLDSMWYHILSIPRGLSHLEIKHELPVSAVLWTAPSAGEWAHRTLIAGPAKPLVRYIDAVRYSVNPALAPPDFKLDSHGAYLVILFLIAGVREVSGWSTMTGRTCYERFEALHSTLQALAPIANASIEVDGNHLPVHLPSAAGWHMCMMELVLWSQPHTRGLVEESLDAALAAATMLSSTNPIQLTPQMVDSLVPHVTWFVDYLERTEDTTFEPPFVAIYAFKAVLLAWQLARTEAYDFASRVGAADLSGVMDWIRDRFERRTSWGVGRLALLGLDELVVE